MNLKYKLLSLSLIISLFGITGCNNEKSNSPESKTTFDLTIAKNEIEEANRNFIDKLSKGDSVGLANCYTSDAKFMAPNGPAVEGRSNIQPVLAGIIKSGATKLNLTISGLWGTEDMLADEGTLTLATADGTLVDKGKYIVLWKKEDGKWKLFRDCFSSDLPIPAASK